MNDQNSWLSLQSTTTRKDKHCVIYMRKRSIKYQKVNLAIIRTLKAATEIDLYILDWIRMSNVLNKSACLHVLRTQCEGMCLLYFMHILYKPNSDHLHFVFLFACLYEIHLLY